MITIKAIENVFDKKQKKELIAKFTDAVEDVYPGIRDVTFVIIEEVKEGDWGIGGMSMDHNSVEAHAKKNS